MRSVDGHRPVQAAGVFGEGAFRPRRGGQVELVAAAWHRLARHAVHRLGRVGERERRERDQVAVDLERVQVDVVDRVARQVVARVELRIDRAAQIAA